jgi:uncharacterized protein
VNMDVLLIAAGTLLMLAGLLGCVLPVIPGPPLSYLGLWLLHWTDYASFSAPFLGLWAGVTVLVVALDIVVPAWGTRRLGGSRRGVWGSVLGMTAGLIFFPPFGIVAGAFAGAVLGELTSGQKSGAALRCGVGALLGYLFGVVLKLTASALMTWYFAKALWL